VSAAKQAAAEPREVDAAGATWLVQSVPLPGLADGPPIGTIVIARNLDVGLALLLSGARLMLVLGALLILAALAAALLVSARLSRPVVELEAAAQRVAAGDLGAGVPTRASRDEVGQLARAFNRMTEGLRERERIKTTFKKYLAPDVVEYLLAHPEAQQPGGERRRLTVMFSDLVGFTTMSEKLPPEDVVRILNTYLAAVSERVIRRGGIVDKFVGDAIMCFFGAPVPAQDHPVRACQAALDHLAALEALAPNWREGKWPELAVRIGINTGDMLVGNIGSDQFQDFTVMGDAVNLASRLEGTNKDYHTHVLATSDVRDATGGAFTWREIDLVRMVGRTQAVRIYELIGEEGCLARDPARRTAHQRYADGLAALRARDFTGAATAFRAALEARPGDGPSEVMLARAEAYRETPPPADWDGVYQKLTK
jgi:class 3 adenylate cyclase